MQPKIVAYLANGFADWEGSFILSEMAEAKIPVLYASQEGKTVRSIGGLTVTTDCAIKDVSQDQISALILIGSDEWMDESRNLEVLQLAEDLLKKETLVAGICAATMALARRGLLNDRPHTSNDLGVLKKYVSSYTGEKLYSEKLAVTGENLITAAGVGPIEFAVEIMNALNIKSADYRQHWYAWFKHGTKPPANFWS